jgi:hypothetical protein
MTETRFMGDAKGVRVGVKLTDNAQTADLTDHAGLKSSSGR